MNIYRKLLEIGQRVIGKGKVHDPAIDKMFKGDSLSVDSSQLPKPDSLEPMENEDDTVENIVLNGDLGKLYDAVVSLALSRKGMYKLYDDMEQDTLVSSGLEMITDDSSQYSMEKEATVWPEECKYKKDIEDLFKAIDIENRGWGWIYSVSKYGDFFLQVIGEPGVGVVRVVDVIHPSMVYRVEVDGKLSAFIVNIPPNNLTSVYDYASVVGGEQYICEPYHYVHFVNNYKPVFDRYSITLNRKDEEGKPVEVKKVITASYGTSTLYNVRQAFRNLKLMEKSLALARLANSPRVRIFYVNTEGMTPKERQEYLKKLQEQFKRKKTLDKDADFFDSRYNPMSYNDDIFIPITGSVGDVRTETLGGDADVKAMVDVDFFRDKFFSGMRIPKAFMGFEESIPGTMGANALTTLDVRYARMCKKVQRSFLQGLYRLCQIHIAYKYKRRPETKDIKLGMVFISSVEESQRLETLEKRFAIATTISQLARDLEGRINPKVLVKYIFENILKLTGVDLEELFKVPKAPPQSGGGFGGFGNTFGATPEEGEGTPEAGEETPEAGEESSSVTPASLVEVKKAVQEIVGMLKEAKKYITTEEMEKGRDTEAPLPVKQEK